MSIYFDNAATTPISAEAKAAMVEAMDVFGNPSSTHAEGRKAKAIVETVRKGIAQRLNCLPAEIIFTAGGTEADNWALLTGIRDFGIQHLYTSALEHHAVKHFAEYIEKNHDVQVHYIPHDAQGVHDLDGLQNHLERHQASGEVAMVSLMHANNEIGNLVDLTALSRICEATGSYLHSDTVQTMAHLPLDFKAIKVHFAACSGHKFHGPKGVGFAYVRQGTTTQPFIQGGAQERGHRAGTENVVGIAGLGAAFNHCVDEMESDIQAVKEVKAHAIAVLQSAFPGVQFNGMSGDMEKSLYTVLNFYHPTLHEGGMLNFQLDINGVQCSGGSACSSGAVGGSHVLNGLGSPGGTRISFSRYSTKDEVDQFVKILQDIVAQV
ncbi:MAG: cysteine desulfurase [Cryomorphaceae bacterium]|jgi:cysteine desulfurase|nr:cysteine desulfurase [Cryomorphaceae bacterium]|tara:strand:- start:173 stop:1309 length:1137 start_codon:yes stop_codon:yes gene_type:complete